jgi:hypothetical protein
VAGAGRPGAGAAAQRPIDVDRTAGDDLGARRHRAKDGEVAVGIENGLAGAHRRLDDHGLGGRLSGGRRRFGAGARLAGAGKLDDLRRGHAARQRREPRPEHIRVDALDGDHPDGPGL